MKKKYMKIYFAFIIFLFYPLLINAETNPFSLKLIKEAPIPENQSTYIVHTDSSVESKNTHPLLKYNLNRYFIKGILIVNDGKYKDRALAIISASGEADHLIQVGDSISDEWPQWEVSSINLRSVFFQKRDGEELDEDGNIIFMKEEIEVLNPLSSKTEN